MKDHHPFNMPRKVLCVMAMCLFIFTSIPQISEAQDLTLIPKKRSVAITAKPQIDIDIDKLFSSLNDANLFGKNATAIDSIRLILEAIREQNEFIKKAELDTYPTIESKCNDWAKDERAKDKKKISFGCIGYLGSSTVLQSEEGINEYLGGFRAFGRSSFAINGNEAGIDNEIVSDNIFISAKLGYAKLGLSTLISVATDEIPSDSTNLRATTSSQFFQSGGNATLYLGIPAIYWRNFIQLSENSEMQFIRKIDVFVYAAASADIPELGSYVDNPAGNLRLGLQGTFTQTTMKEILNVYVHSDVSMGRGSSKFYDNLGTDFDKPLFFTGKIELGLDIYQSARIGFSTGISNMGISQKWRLSFKIIPR